MAEQEHSGAEEGLTPITEGARRALARLADLVGLRKGVHVAEVIFEISRGKLGRLDCMLLEDLENRARDLFAAAARLQRERPSRLGVTAQDREVAVAVLVRECQRTGALALAARREGRRTGQFAVEQPPIRFGHWTWIGPEDTLH